MEKVILETIKKYNLFESNSTVIVAVSGGADSMALLHILAKRLSQLRLQLVVAHVNHKKRVTANLDEALVKEVAKTYGIPYEVYQLPKSESTRNFHEYARSKRYAFFKEVAKAYGSHCIVTAHHADDHLETLLQRLLYYNTARGLIGIKPLSQQGCFTLVRPFIEVTKAEIYKYCESQQIKFLEDESNRSQIYTRNRIREKIISGLVQESPTIYKHARMISEQLSEDEAYFIEQVEELMKQVNKKNEVYEVSRTLLQKLPKSLSRRLVKKILQQFSYRDMTSNHIEEIIHLASSSKPNLEVSLPHHITCIMAYDVVQFSNVTLQIKPYEYELYLNSKVILPTKETIIVKHSQEVEKKEKSCINYVYLCYNEIDLPLKVRTRINGDRISLMNHRGTKKVKDIMIDAKIPKQLRDQWPIITDAKGQIIWIPLLKKSAYCQTDIVDEAIVLKYIGHGGNEEDA